MDLIRGLAALVVLIYHVRYRFFLDYNDIADPEWMTKLLYAATSFGHDAVIVFFVLSGYFISSSNCTSLNRGTWSWVNYLRSRVTRLYLVLIPGLLLTVFGIGLDWNSMARTQFILEYRNSGKAKPFRSRSG